MAESSGDLELIPNILLSLSNCRFPSQWFRRPNPALHGGVRYAAIMVILFV